MLGGMSVCNGVAKYNEVMCGASHPGVGSHSELNNFHLAGRGLVRCSLFEGSKGKVGRFEGKGR